jgi:glycosyltransferase involved in cell wall biosynthesis
MENGSRAVPQLISVIVPVHNGERYLGEALASIFAQDYRPIEVIVVDDGSTDGTAAIARSFLDIRYFHEEKQGRAVAINTGIESSRGEYIAFLDADDIWLPDVLSIQIEYLVKHPETGGVCGRMRNFLDPGAICPSWIDPDTLLRPTDFYSTCTMLARRSLFEAVGNFNPTYKQGQDLEWFFRVKESGIPIGNIPDTVLLRRIHENNISHNQNGSVQARLRMLKESIERKRGAAARPSGAH